MGTGIMGRWGGTVGMEGALGAAWGTAEVLVRCLQDLCLLAVFTRVL